MLKRISVFVFLIATWFPWIVNSSLPSKLIDLTYSCDEKTIYWPTEKGFKLEPIFYGETSRGFFYAANKFCVPEHGGTHLDAPRHFFKYGLTVDQIPIDALQGDVVVINVESHIKKNRDYAFSVEDIKQFEKKYRAIREGDIVLFYTGWGKFWGDKSHYLGTDVFRDINHLHFPGISKEAATYLVSKKVKGVGLDTPSLDPGSSLVFLAHQIILGANIYGLENIANLHELPPVGATLIVAPMKIVGGSGAPTRLYGLNNIDRR